MSGGLWLKTVENLLLTVGALLTELAADVWSSLSNGLTQQEEAEKRQNDYILQVVFRQRVVSLTALLTE